MELYKKILAKTGRDAKKAMAERSREIEIIENENVNLLAEVRDLKEE